MGEAKRRKLAGHADYVRDFANEVLSGGVRTVAVGPVVWGVAPGHDVKHWYFTVGSADARDAFRIDLFKVQGNFRELAEQYRSGLMVEFVNRRSALVIHSFEDELAQARFCETMWPCDKTRELRTSLEREPV